MKQLVVESSRAHVTLISVPEINPRNDWTTGQITSEFYAFAEKKEIRRNKRNIFLFFFTCWGGGGVGVDSTDVDIACEQVFILTY